MIDPFAKSLLDAAQSPIAKDETSSFVGLGYLKKIAKIYFDTSEEIDVASLSEELSKLSLAASILIDTNISEKDISTAFLIAESAEIAFDEIASSDDADIRLVLASITHLLDIASFFHLCDFDANANVLAGKALTSFNRPFFENHELVSLAQVTYYRSLAFYLKGQFGDLINEGQKKVIAVTTQDSVFLRLIDILVELTRYYRGLTGLSDKSVSDLNTLGEVLTSSGLYMALNSEIFRLQSLANAATRKALYPLLTDKFSNQKGYLDTRISGVIDGGYPFAWPPVKTFCEEYLSGKNHHAVVALPTGSGKSFLAELAIVNSIQIGWILYLAPTNALCAQIKNDLKRNLSAVESSDVNLFLGGIEYIPDIVDLKPVKNYVAVMTPEKASLLLKLYPEKARDCSLLIVDECHMLGEASRGTIVEFVLAAMLNISTNIHVILMSALMRNAKELGNWLLEKTGKTYAILQDNWKPTRSSRIALTQDWSSLREVQVKRHIEYQLPIIAVSDAYTPWTNDNEHYFSWPTNLFIKFADLTKFQPSKNDTATDLAMSLAAKNVQTQIIVFSSKHHVFSTAEKVTNLPGNNIEQSQNEFDWLVIAHYELGIQSIVQTLISEKQVSVHSTVILQAERKASEDAFNRRRTKVMVSTTTLAQGLNLNSQVVILAGTEFYADPNEYDEEDIIELDTRSLQQVLNGCGRAARANITNRGFSVIIPSPNIRFPAGDVKTEIIKLLPVIAAREDFFDVSSKIYALLDNVQIGNLDALPNHSESQLLLLLPTNSEEILSFLNKTLASSKLSGEKLQSISTRFIHIKETFIQNDVPDWLLHASHISSMDLALMIELKNYIQSLDQEISAESYVELANLLISWLEQLTPDLTWDFLSTHIKRWRWWFRGIDQDPDIIQQITSGEIILDNSKEPFIHLWGNLRECANLWLEDGTYLDIGNTLVRGKCKSEHFSLRSSPGRPIPRAIVWSQKTMDKFSIFAGGLSALRDLWRENDEEGLPKWLANSRLVQSLPMAIRFGVNNPTSLVWYRSAIGERRIANFLSQLVPFKIDNPLDSDEISRFLIVSKEYLNENDGLENQKNLILIIRRLANN